MTSAEIKTILEEHSKWLKNNKNGKCADLSGADLRGTNLSYADLGCADLRGANLRGTNLSHADLRWADLRCADLRGANLSNEDLRWADLRCADFRDANLSNANFGWADLRGADLSDVDLGCADLRGANLCRPITCPEKGSFIGWKKASSYIVELEILSDAKRSSATGRECRCDKAKVVAIENIDGSESHVTEVNSNYDTSFVYKVGEIVSIDDFDDNRWKECAPGIHFFITREEAIRYNKGDWE